MPSLEFVEFSHVKVVRNQQSVEKYVSYAACSTHNASVKPDARAGLTFLRFHALTEINHQLELEFHAAHERLGCKTRQGAAC